MPKVNKTKIEVNRTVSFWRFVRLTDGAPLAQADWPGILGDWAMKTRHSKITHSVDQQQLSGRVHTISEVDHLVITKDRDDVPRQQHRRTGAVEEITTNDENWEVVESTFISFLSFGNVFGFLQSAPTAASPAAVARWINETGILNHRVAAEPVIDPDRWQKVRAAGGVTKLEIAGPVNLVNQLADGPLQGLFGRQKEGHYKVKVQVSTGRTRADRQQREELHAAAEHLNARGNAGAGVQAAKATVFDDAGVGIGSQEVNLIKQRFSRKEEVLVIGGPGERAISESSACQAILRVAGDLEAQLRVATGTAPSID